MPDLLLADADLHCGILLNTAEDGTVTSRVQIAKTGKFTDPRYGKFSITRAQFTKWVENFKAISLAHGRLGLPIDVDHGPEKFGKTEAAGWAIDLDTLGEDGKTATPDELWATVQWNTLGVELVKDRRYAYLSPSYQHNYKDETGKQWGTALVGVGLTNRPFLTMANVALDAIESNEVSSSDSSQRMSLEMTTTILSAMGLDENADEASVLSKLAELSKPTPTEVNLDELAQAEGKVVLDATKVQELVAGAQAGQAAVATLSEMKFNTVFEKAVSDGRAVPSMKDTYEKLYKLDAETTLSALADAPKVLNTEAQGSGGNGPGADPREVELAEDAQIDPERMALHQKALALASEKNIDYAEAVHLVQGA